MLWAKIKAIIGYWFARRLFNQRWAVSNEKLWAWMQGQFSRKAALGDVAAQSFYGHLLLFKGQGFGAKQEAIRLLKQAANGGDAKAAFQLGQCYYTGSMQCNEDKEEARQWWEKAQSLGHPLAETKLASF